MKSALEQVSDHHEQAKADLNATLRDKEHLMTEVVIKQTEVSVWGHALQILQSCRGSIVG